MKLQVFMIKKITKEETNHTCLAVINLDSALKKDENHNHKIHWEKRNGHINDNLSEFSYSDVSYEE